VSEPTALTPLEAASGLVFGDDPRAPEVAVLPGVEPRAALEDAIRPALERPPCLVSFSGGRDSSAVLAVATALARREGHRLPIPATNRFHGIPSSQESEWQEEIVAALDLEDWVRIPLRDELDCVGPIAQGVLERHGVLWPFNAHFHVPLIQQARTGSLLTGLGGDEAFSASRWERTQLLLSGRASPRPRDVLRVTFALAPRRARARVLRGRMPSGLLPWLRAPAREAVERLSADEAASEPVRWSSRYRWLRRLRHMEVAVRSLDVLGAEHDVLLTNPLCDVRFLGALAGLPRHSRFRTRTEAMGMLVGDLLPESVLGRSTKASFDQAFWHDHSRAFAASWSGEGHDRDLVDVDLLRAMWRQLDPDPRSYLLAQAAWLAEQRSAGQVGEQLDRGLERAPGPGTDELERGTGDEIEQSLRIPGRHPKAALGR
jgi:asparagine synthetase B (glutamine-hydrolysing)